MLLDKKPSKRVIGQHTRGHGVVYKTPFKILVEKRPGGPTSGRAWVKKGPIFERLRMV
ncbi:hypothetical protein HanRHA438_Chr16g0782071 [Helianthus annuus]|nr:hypothetical protein HanRHA438_Chr16g0782071 [Helianthus annuus]